MPLKLTPLSRPHRRTSLLLGLMALGVGGFAGLSGLAAHAPHQATLLHGLALGWLLMCGIARLAVVIFDKGDEAPSRLGKRSWSAGPWG